MEVDAFERHAVGVADGTLQSQAADFIAQASVPRHAFGTREAAEDHMRRLLLDMNNGMPRGENGGIATAFYDPDSSVYFVYGPDNVRNYPAEGSIPGFQRALESHEQRALEELGPNSSYATGGIVLNGFFHTLRPGSDGAIRLGDAQ